MPVVGAAFQQQQLITIMVAVLFVLGLLYKNWLLEIRDWIEAKVSS